MMNNDDDEQPKETETETKKKKKRGCGDEGGQHVRKTFCCGAKRDK